MYKLLTSNFDTQNSQEIRQIILLNLLLIFAALFSIFFGLFNFFILKNYLLLSLNLLGFFLSAGVFLDARINKNLNRSTTTTVIIITLYFIVFTLLNKNDGYGLFWISTVPVFVVGLIGTKRSLIFLSFYFSIVFFAAYSGIGEWQNGEWNTLGFMRLVFSSLLMTIVVMMMDLALIKSYENYEKLSSIDILTNINNRRKTQEILSIEMQRAQRYETDLALILFDIDDFKKINDEQGHKIGDLVLQELSKVVQESIRSSDSFGRWGGEEFLIIIPETNKEHALQIAEKIRQNICEASMKPIYNLTCSFGVSLFCKNEDSQEIFIDKADKAMYQAKQLGKNRVEFF